MIHAYEVAPSLAGQSAGKETCCVGAPVCLDEVSKRHLLVTVPQGEHFIFCGSLPLGKASYSFIRVKIEGNHSPVVVVSTDATSILSHEACTWGGTKKVVELCCGLGAMGQGAKAAGFQPTIGCDMRKKMCELYERHSGAPAIHGDICKIDTLIQIFEKFPFCGTVAAGVACQPYSVLGDGRGGEDPRSSSLPATLAISYYLRAVLVIIECVGPAKDDPFVNHHINTFCKKTRFFRADCLLDLQEVWPSRRHRWWCILSAPAIGQISIKSWSGFPDLSLVEHVLPSIPRWPSVAESELQLSPVELEAFRVGDHSGRSYILNKKSTMACALHCWGAQLTPCPCGCRTQGLSPARLASKGLFGVLVESATNGLVRHIHPQEAAALCGLDPNLKWGSECRLSLGAVGQLASPVQAVWVFSHALKALQIAQFQQTSVDPSLMLRAYRTWLLARCQHLVDDSRPRFPASETLAYVGVFHGVERLTMHELIAKVGIQNQDRTIQGCWEILSKQELRQVVCPEILSSADATGTAQGDVCTPTSVAPPCTESPTEGLILGLTVSQVAIDQLELEISDVDSVEPEVSVPNRAEMVATLASPVEGHVCLQTLQFGELDEPVAFRLSGNPTVDSLQTAECNLRGLKRKAAHVFEDGSEVSPSHVIQLGSTYLLDFGYELSPSPSNPPLESSLPAVDDPAVGSDEASIVDNRKPEDGPCVEQSFSGLHALLVSDSSPRFLKLQVPIANTWPHVVSLLDQRSTVQDRLISLDQQNELWGDDEVRWHMSRLQAVSNPDTHVYVFEPLLIHGCFQSQDFRPIAQWVAAHHRMNSVYIAVVLQDHHWYPVFLNIGWEGVKAKTWDLPGVKHSGLETFVESVAAAIGLHVHSILQLDRLFSGSKFCGALSIAFLEHLISQTVLPETKEMAESHHTHLRGLFRQAVSEADFTWRPWLWGAGVGNADFDKAVELLQPHLVAHGVPSDHAHHRAQQAVKVITASEVVRACQGKSPWKTLKQLGTNAKFQFITSDELQVQIEQRAGKGPVGKPKKSKQVSIKDVSTSITLDPAKLSLPEGAFTGGGKILPQIPVTMLGPVAEGVAIATLNQAEPYLRASQVVASGALALLVLNGPTGSCHTTLPSTSVTIPARCLVNQEPLLLEATLVQLGSEVVTKTTAVAPVELDTVQVATVKITVFRDESLEAWDEVSGAPLKYIIKSIPLLRFCRGDGCTCPCWHNTEKINVSDAIIDVWRRQFLRAGYKPEPVSSAVMFSVCVRIPQCLLARVLCCSGEGGVYVEPRSMDSREVSSEYEVIWMPRADKATVTHLRQVNPAAAGLARVGDRFGVRTASTHAAELHKVLRPDAVYLSTGVRQQYMVGPIPYGTDRKALSRTLTSLPWAVKPLQPIAAIDGQRGVMWSVLAVTEPPSNIINMSHGEVLITKQKDTPAQKPSVQKSVATPSTLSLCGSNGQRGPDPWAKSDPWSGYRVSQQSDSHVGGLVTAAESMHQLEAKIEKAVLSKIPQSFAMDQDDVPDKLQELESKFQTLVTRQQQLEGMVQEQSVQTTAQFGQMQAQLNAQGQQMSVHMESQQHQIQQMFDSQMSQIRSLLSKRKCEGEHE